MNNDSTLPNPVLPKTKAIQMKHFRFYSKQDILSLTTIRKFETKLGERIKFVADPQQFEEYLASSTAKYVLFGIPEDIGIRANHGMTWFRFSLAALPAIFPEYSKQ